MPLRFGIFAVLIGIYVAGMQLAAHQAPTWMVASLMAVIFLALVAAMYLRLLPALLALPLLAIALASIAGMGWRDILTSVVEDGGMRLKTAILAALMGSILAQVVEKTGIAQTAIKKTAELGGDRPMVLAVILTLVIAMLFTVLGGLGAVIMVATIAVPILLSLGLRPLFVGSLFLMALSLGGAFNLANWELYKTTLSMTNEQIGYFAWPFAGLMLVTTAAFMIIEGRRMGKARYKAVVSEDAGANHDFVPWYALLTPLVPLVPVLAFILIPKIYAKPAEVTVSLPKTDQTCTIMLRRQEDAAANTFTAVGQLVPGASRQLDAGQYQVGADMSLPAGPSAADPAAGAVKLDAKPWNRYTVVVTAVEGESLPRLSVETTPLTYDFPISVALLLGILYGAISTWKRGQSTVQLLTKAAIDGVAAVGPAVVLMLGIGMVLIATMSDEVSGVIKPIMGHVVPGASATGPGAMLHYVLLFAVLAPLALYRGPLNLWGMGSGLVGVLSKIMPVGAIMGAFMSVGMIQGVCDPTNTHNVWIANYTGTDVQDILKRTLPYMWGLAVVGLLLSAVLYYLPHP